MDIKILSQIIINDNVLNRLIIETQITYQELSILVKKDSLEQVMIKLKKEEAYSFGVLIDICGIDYPNKKSRFTVVYQLLSLKHNQRIKVKVETSDEDFIPSIKSIFSTAHWYEREVWDMYGIFFEGNDDLRRILTDYGFSGFPMRKDFPLTGNVEVRYDMEKQKIIYEPVKLAQEFRDFDFQSPWEGEEYILPGDEKTTKK